MNFFKKAPTVKEQQRQNDRELRRAGRTMERDKAALEREEKKLEMEIKKMAEAGNKEGCTILAKQLVQLRKQKNRVYAANSKISSIGVQNKSMGANVAIADAIGTTSKTMANMNKVMNPQKLAHEMEAFKHASAKMDMTDEMISDTLNDILDESGDEEETEGVVSQVLDEIGIEISGKMSNAPIAERGNIGKSVKNADEDIEAQLARLKS